MAEIESIKQLHLVTMKPTTISFNLSNPQAATAFRARKQDDQPLPALTLPPHLTAVHLTGGNTFLGLNKT